jgi:hypothetical protein
MQYDKLWVGIDWGIDGGKDFTVHTFYDTSDPLASESGRSANSSGQAKIKGPSLRSRAPVRNRDGDTCS